jgi:hypothetical protein
MVMAVNSNKITAGKCFVQAPPSFESLLTPPPPGERPILRSQMISSNLFSSAGLQFANWDRQVGCVLPSSKELGYAEPKHAAVSQ